MTGKEPLLSLTNSFLEGYSQSPIGQCTSSWNQFTERTIRGVAPTDWTWFDTFLPNVDRIWTVMEASKFQKLLLGLLIAALVIAVVWNSFLSTYLAPNRAVWDYLKTEGSSEDGEVSGTIEQAALKGMVHLADLDPVHLPRSAKTKLDKTKKGKRIIFIGDIHGHMKELQALLSKAKYNPEKDHIVALGDMINKGPDSKGVVDFLMSRHASCVRGNHEDHILTMAKNLQAPTLSDQSDHSVSPSKESTKDREERALARSLTSKQIKWLSACPLILRIGEVHPFGQIVAVHGGLLPGVPLHRQDPTAIMNMRIVNLKTHIPSHKHNQEGSIPWSEFWNKYQRLLPAQQILFGKKKTQHTTVVYGHDARRGVRLDTYTKGLDSGCGNGKALTAWIVGEYGRERLLQVSNQSKGK